MRKPVGLDLNGWRDFACRDWRIDDPDEEPGVPDLVDGGFGAVVVVHDGETIGGPQAILSPIGRGNGWGEIGAREKRRALSDLWHAFLAGGPDSRFAADISAAADALSVQADDIVFCMPDRAVMNEARQQDLLAALKGPRRARVTLLWRPVAMLLDLLDGGALPHAEEGMRIACIIHGQDGLEVQNLVLRHLTGHPDHPAPERDGSGELHCPELGLARLLAHAGGAVADANPTLHARPTEPSRLPLDLLFRDFDPPAEEVVRRDNGNWILLHPPSDFCLPDLTCDCQQLCADSDLVLVMSPLASRHHAWLTGCLSGLDAQVQVVEPAAAARGALRAARRIERGIPHYLDRLDQVSLAVLRPSGPVFEDLIPPGATVPGNREYVSDPITSMVWTEGMATAQFFIRKGEREIRHWVTPEITAPVHNQHLEVRLRQMPAQGWAKLAVTAPDWDELRRAPIRLDWAALEIDPRSAAEILAELEGPRPVVPERVRYHTHIGLWDGSLRRPGLGAILQALNADDPTSLKRLADTLTTGYRIAAGQLVFPVGTDGDLPDSLDAASAQQFGDTIDRLSARLLHDVARGKTQADNHALRCLTWIFALCPGAVKNELAVALHCIQSGQSHPLLGPVAASRVVVHGLGRVATDPAMLRALIPHLSANLGQPNFLAALSSLLSRPEATPRILAELGVAAIADRVTGVFRTLHAADSFEVDLKYALLAVAGLLRVRERDPWALVADRSAEAKRLSDVVTDVADRIESRRRSIRNPEVKLEMARELIELLSGAGGRPDILAIMDEMDA